MRVILVGLNWQLCPFPQLVPRIILPIPLIGSTKIFRRITPRGMPGMFLAGAVRLPEIGHDAANIVLP
jgi:hypothetical protein